MTASSSPQTRMPCRITSLHHAETPIRSTSRHPSAVSQATPHLFRVSKLWGASSSTLRIQFLSLHDHFGPVREPYRRPCSLCLHADRGKTHLRRHGNLLRTDPLCHTFRLACIGDHFDIIGFVGCRIDFHHCPFFALLKHPNGFEQNYRIIAFRLAHIFPLWEIQGH